MRILGRLTSMPNEEAGSDREIAREIVLRHGWNSTCYQILNPGIRLWFNAGRTACIGYVQRGRTLVVAGAPVCTLAELEGVISEWEIWAKARGFRACYFGAERRMRDYVAQRSGYTTVVLGAQPEWSPEEFIDSIRTDRSLRAQLNRARNKGVAVAEWPREASEGNADLWRVLQEWLSTRGLPPLHFLVEPETLSDMRDRRLFVATRDEKPIAFVTLCPVAERNGWLTEQFVHAPRAPNGTVELALFHAIDAVRQDGAEYVTMGIVPLSPHGNDATIGNPRWLESGAEWARVHGRRLYNFDGLDRFKSKFHPPIWEPVVAISREPGFSLRTLRAIAAAFAVGSLEGTLAAGLWRMAFGRRRDRRNDASVDR